MKPRQIRIDRETLVPSPVYSRERVRVRAGGQTDRSAGDVQSPEGKARLAPRFCWPPTPTLTLSRGYTGEGTRRAFAAFTLLALSGCAAKPDPIPHYPATDAAESVKIIRDRLAGLKSVRGDATLVLTNEKGESIRLDAAYAFAAPNRLRLRAWKFGQAVFDLTLDGDEAWAYIPRQEAKAAMPKLDKRMLRWATLITDARQLEGEAKVNWNTLTIDHGFDPMARLTIDRPTLTVRHVEWIPDTLPRPKVPTLSLSDYRPGPDGQVWPGRVVAEFGKSKIDIRSGEVEINADLPDATFKPPARAEKLP